MSLRVPQHLLPILVRLNLGTGVFGFVQNDYTQNDVQLTYVRLIVQCKINLRQTLAILVGRELASNLSSPCSTIFDKYVEKKEKKKKEVGSCEAEEDLTLLCDLSFSGSQNDLT